jgi:hypothetical protein
MVVVLARPPRSSPMLRTSRWTAVWSCITMWCYVEPGGMIAELQLLVCTTVDLLI